MSTAHDPSAADVPAPGRSHAVVLGGSLAGLLAARVLAAHYDRVTLIERDRYPQGPGPRRGLPQARHAHVLMMRGMASLERLLPGLRQELLALGAARVDCGRDLVWLTPQGWAPRFEAGLEMLSLSRDLLDFAVRRRVLDLGAVVALEETEASGVEVRSGAVVGVRLRAVAGAPRGDHAAPARSERILDADLVVDATGRGSRTALWLTEMGLETPAETVVDARVSYASRLYAVPAGASAAFGILFVQAAPPEHPRAGVVFRIEGDRWLVTLAGAGDDAPPSDPDGFLAWAAALRTPRLHQAIRSAEPLGPIAVYRAMSNRRRHWERLRAPLEGLVVMGDAACSFNPVYGQGMTAAALQALALDHRLRRSARSRRPPAAARFARRVARVNAGPWALATGEDLRYRDALGARPSPATRLLHRLVDRVVARSLRDLELRRLWLEVFQMLRPPTALCSPAVLWRLLRPAPGPVPEPAGGESETRYRRGSCVTTATSRVSPS